MNFTVIRSKWYRGKGADDSMLLRNDGTSCCLGFYGTACGIEEDDMINIGYPANADIESWPKWIQPASMAKNHSKDCELAMEINDDASITDAEREAKLTELFAKHGDVVTFID